MKWQPFEFCRACGQSFLPEELSGRGLCSACAKERLRQAIRQMQAKQGPIWDMWRRNYIAAMDGVLNRLRKELQEHD